MDYESFKEKFVEDLKDRLDEQGADVKVSVNTVNKLKHILIVLKAVAALYGCGYGFLIFLLKKRSESSKLYSRGFD